MKMKFFLKDHAIFMTDGHAGLDGHPLPVIRDQQAPNEVLKFVLAAMNEKVERDPQKLDTYPEPAPTGGRPLGRG